MFIQSDPEQPYIALPLPIMPGSVDFVKYQKLLTRIDDLLRESGIERMFEEHAVSVVEAEGKKNKTTLSYAQSIRVKRHASQMLRCNIARSLSQEDYRAFSTHLADSQTLQNFCHFDHPNARLVTPSKSTLQRGATRFGEDIVRKLVQRLISDASRADGGICRKAGLVEPISLDVILMDSTCIELDIHHPVDWVLLKDAVKSLIRAIETIRRHGLFHRMPDPRSLVSQANKLSMQMTQASKRGKSLERKTRKETLRELKKLAKIVGRHAQRYREVLVREWKTTDLSEGEMNQILKRIDNILTKLPDVIHQAHERIIGERKVKNEEKILSLYEPHAKVYTRGKAGSEVEFGLQLLIGETIDGLILDWELVDGAPLNDTKHIQRHLTRMQQLPAEMMAKMLVTDRGFDCKENVNLLEDNNIKNLMCPKNPAVMAERMGDNEFVSYQRRRAQTEARIGIMKHCFIGSKMPAKGFDKQNKHVSWAVLSHNLWVLARLPNRFDEETDVNDEMVNSA